MGVTQHEDCEYKSKRYHGMLYRCADCGREETFDGIAVAARNPIYDDAECVICQMELVDAAAYWNNEIEPDEVNCHVCV